MPKAEHLALHAQILEKTLLRPDVKEKARQAHQSAEYKEKVSRIMSTEKMKKVLSERAKKQWNDENYKEYMIKKFIEFYKSNEEYRKKVDDLLNSIFEEKDDLNYYMLTTALSLFGNQFESLFIHTGKGGNGKGVLSEIIEKCNLEKVKEEKLLLLKMKWKGWRGFEEGVLEIIVLPLEKIEIIKKHEK
jgi:hypothetical protein